MNYRDAYLTLRKKIRLYCLRCCGGSHKGVAECHDALCPWHAERTEAVQIELFDEQYRELWIVSAVEAIERLDISPGCYWSEIRDIICGKTGGVHGPGHPNWWGSVASRLLKTGRYEIDRNAGRTHPGHGSRENFWRMREFLPI